MSLFFRKTSRSIESQELVYRPSQGRLVFDNEFFGNTPPGVYNVTVPGIPSAEAFGAPLIEFYTSILVSGIPSAEAFGVLSVSGAFTAEVSGIPSAGAFGNPEFSNFNVISPLGIPSSEAFGTGELGDVFDFAPPRYPVC